MKTKDVKIWFAPIGGAMKFQKDTIRRFDGTMEYYKMLRTLVRNVSISKIYLLQKSDWAKLNDLDKIEFDPRNVLVDVYSDFIDEGFSRDNVRPANIKAIHEDPSYKELALFLEKKQVKFDYGIGIIGMGYFTNTSIPNFLGSSRGEPTIVKVRWSTYNYSSPIIHFLNENLKSNNPNVPNSATGETMPWFLVANDPRYIKKRMRLRDTMNSPAELIAQYDMDCVWESYDKYEGNHGANKGETVTPTRIMYTGIEKIAQVNSKFYSPELERNTKFMVIAMQSAYGAEAQSDTRLRLLNDYVLKYDTENEVEIYGKWNDYFRSQHKQLKGFIKFEDIDTKLRDTRYTLAVPIGNDWVTAKYADTIAQGVLPFFSKNYDTQHHLVPKDHFIRVKDGKDLANKMAYLDANPEKRIGLVKALQVKWLTGVKSGQIMYDILNASCERSNIDVRLGEEQSEEVKRKTRSTTLF